MKRGNINSVLILVVFSFVFIIIGSALDMFSLTGKATECPKAPLTLFKCPEGYGLVANYNVEGCIYKYQ